MKYYNLIILPIIFTFLIVNCFAAEKNNFSEDYAILIQKNIFSKNRVIISHDKHSEGLDQQADTSNFELRYILRGISSVDGIWVGFFEDINTGLCSIVHVDDEFNGGKIAAISAEGLVYKIEQQQIKIQIGTDLTGSDSVSNSAEDFSLTTTEVPDENNDILKRLMEKRKKDLDQK